MRELNGNNLERSKRCLKVSLNLQVEMKMDGNLVLSLLITKILNQVLLLKLQAQAHGYIQKTSMTTARKST